MAQTKYSMILQDARRAGRAAASWCMDGNTEGCTYERVLRGIEDGDPEILDMFNLPNLSGEFAGDPTPQSLQSDYELSDEQLGDYCTFWEVAAEDAFWRELARIARYHIGGK